MRAPCTPVSLQQGGHDGAVSVQARRQVRHGHAWTHRLPVLPAEETRVGGAERDSGKQRDKERVRSRPKTRTNTVTRSRTLEGVKHSRNGF